MIIGSDITEKCNYLSRCIHKKYFNGLQTKADIERSWNIFSKNMYVENMPLSKISSATRTDVMEAERLTKYLEQWYLELWGLHIIFTAQIYLENIIRHFVLFASQLSLRDSVGNREWEKIILYVKSNAPQSYLNVHIYPHLYTVGLWPFPGIPLLPFCTSSRTVLASNVWNTEWNATADKNMRRYTNKPVELWKHSVSRMLPLINISLTEETFLLRVFTT